MPTQTLDNVAAFMFAYQQLHLPGKINAVSAIYRLYKEIKRKDLWLDNQALKSNKDAILNAIAMHVVSSSMMMIEDFVKMCYSMTHDILAIPSTMASYATIDSMLNDINRGLVTEGDQLFLRALHYLVEDDLKAPGLTFLSEKDRELIVRQHKQNAKAARHTYSYAIRVYETFRRSYNKHKHGYPFLFGMATPEAASGPLSRLNPAIPYFAYESNLEIVDPVFIGEVVLDKIDTLIEGAGGVSSLLRDFTDNVMVRCKYGGRKIIARIGYGPPILTPDEANRFTQLISEFDKRFVIGPMPKKHELKVKSDFKRSDWDYFDQDWTMK